MGLLKRHLYLDFGENGSSRRRCGGEEESRSPEPIDLRPFGKVGFQSVHERAISKEDGLIMNVMIQKEKNAWNQERRSSLLQLLSISALE